VLQIRQGRVKPVTSKEFKKLREEQGWKVLDVRPPEEVNKAEVKDTVQVPLFVVDDDPSFGGLLKQVSAFGMGGWWLGGKHMKPNETFLADVQQQLNKDQPVIVCCQKGLRSLSACEQLAKAGYEQIGWLTGGFDSCEKEDLETVTGIDVRYAGIGGLSEALGWTEVQQREKKGFMGGFENILKIFALVLVLDTLLFAVEAIMANMRK